MLLLPWAGLEGGHATPCPHPSTPGQSHRLRAQQTAPEPAPRGATRTRGEVRRPSGVRPAPTNGAPPPRQLWAAPSFSPGAAAVISAEPTLASSPAPCQPPWSLTSYPEWRASIGLGHPPLGWAGSLVPTVEQKAAHPWAGTPTPPPAYILAPIHPHQTSRAPGPWQPPPPTKPSWPALPTVPTNPTPSPGPPALKGLQGKLHPTRTRSC